MRENTRDENGKDDKGIAKIIDFIKDNRAIDMIDSEDELNKNTYMIYAYSFKS